MIGCATPQSFYTNFGAEFEKCNTLLIMVMLYIVLQRFGAEFENDVKSNIIYHSAVFLELRVKNMICYCIYQDNGYEYNGTLQN